ncbi:DoxX family protein [Pseudonocardia acaciae]|uniref:DoxX family protein n=1 Tax=Pseudonocardia acaciae TaxID=551276 RepID=UPI0006870773|nr:DoxX family protein [Pseudonocardia acaciae]
MRGFVASRVSGGAAAATAVIRVLFGLFFVFFGLLKFIAHELELAEFVRYGFPDSGLVVYLVGLLEMGAGLMLVLGLGTRLAAAGLAVVMAGAILTAGVRVGGWFHLGVAPTALAAMLYLLWAGAGSRALDGRLAGRAHPVSG